MSNTSLTDSYLNLSGLNSALSKFASECTNAQLQCLGVNFQKKIIGYFSILPVCGVKLSF